MKYQKIYQKNKLELKSLGVFISSCHVLFVFFVKHSRSAVREIAKIFVSFSEMRRDHSRQSDIHLNIINNKMDIIDLILQIVCWLVS